MADNKAFKDLGDHPSRREILAHWDPEDKCFWEKYGKRVANQNLWVSTWALTLSFVVWTLWATIAAQLNQVGFHFTDE
ncbi:MAG: nitrate/nitrite transporter, partial [Selenomonadaceae bacterium]|nr:nitrate/nitrite transporter [Selenomonadaceae bacterium]